MDFIRGVRFPPVFINTNFSMKIFSLFVAIVSIVFSIVVYQVPQSKGYPPTKLTTKDKDSMPCKHHEETTHHGMPK